MTLSILIPAHNEEGIVAKTASDVYNALLRNDIAHRVDFDFTSMDLNYHSELSGLGDSPSYFHGFCPSIFAVAKSR